MSVRRPQVISLYKHLITESKKFPNYNFRAYALRRVRDSFRDNKMITDPKLIKKEYDYGIENLNIIRKQIIVGDLYRTDKLVIEKPTEK